MADKSPRRWFQFRLQTILWLMLLIAVGLGTYWRGYQAGRADKANQRSQVGSLIAKVYSVSDIVPRRQTKTGVIADLDALARDVSTQVLPNTWTESGGNAAIVPFETNLSLVVSHDLDGHERVAAYLERLRARKQKQLLTAR